MGESNGEWGTLASADPDLAEVWDTYERLPDAGDHDVLDRFCERKNISIGGLVRLGARLSDAHVLAFAYPGGIKYRDMVTGKRWSYTGSTWEKLKIIPSPTGPSPTAIITEGETDGARLTEIYDADIAILPAGALTFKPEWAEQLTQYELVLVGLDADDAGERGAAAIIEQLPNAMRFSPPANDWCASNTGDLPPLPQELVRTELPLIVPGDMLLELEEPAIASWYEQALVPVGGFVMIHGPAKSFKSYMGFDMLTQLAQGEPWAGFEPSEEACKVLVVQYEIPWAYYRQRVLQMRAHTQDQEVWAHNFHTWTPLSRPKLKAGDRTQEDLLLRSMVDAGIQVVLIDPVRRAAGEADMNAENEVRKMLSFFERINGEGITVVATHHDTKDASRHRGGDIYGMTGSGAFVGDPDTIMSIELPYGDDMRTSTRRNIHFTLRNAPSVPGRAFQMNEDGHLTYANETWDTEEDLDPTAPEI